MARSKVRETIDKDFFLEVSLGNVDGFNAAFILGNTFNQNKNSGRRTVWDYEGPRTRLEANTPLYISSTSPSDVFVTFSVSGLDENLEPKNEFIATNGLSGVYVGDFRYVNNVTLADFNFTNVGDVYVGTNSNPPLGKPASNEVVSMVRPEFGVSHNGFFMIPAGKIGIVTAQRMSTNSNINNPATIFNILKPQGLPEYITSFSATNAGFNEATFRVPVSIASAFGELAAVLPAGTELEYQAEVDQNNTQVFAGADLVLVDESLVTLSENP